MWRATERNSNMSKESQSYFAVYATAGDIAVAHSETAWAALLSGDLNAALAAEPHYIDMKSGDTISRRAAERYWRATASGRKTSTVEKMNALAAEVYGGDGPWARRRP